jgi:hypothetical protein
MRRSHMRALAIVVELWCILGYTFVWGRFRKSGFDRFADRLEVCVMRLVALFLATLPMTATLSCAEDAPVMSVTKVSFSQMSDVTSDRVIGGADRQLGFDMGRPEGSGLDDTAVRRAAPRATVRDAQSASKKGFRMPWQTGVFQ